MVPPCALLLPLAIHPHLPSTSCVCAVLRCRQDVDLSRPRCIIPLENVLVAGKGNKMLVLSSSARNGVIKSVKTTTSGPEQKLRPTMTLKAATQVQRDAVTCVLRCEGIVCCVCVCVCCFESW